MRACEDLPPAAFPCPRNAQTRNTRYEARGAYPGDCEGRGVRDGTAQLTPQPRTSDVLNATPHIEVHTHTESTQLSGRGDSSRAAIYPSALRHKQETPGGSRSCCYWAPGSRVALTKTKGFHRYTVGGWYKLEERLTQSIRLV